jgi:hypothetical protein
MKMVHDIFDVGGRTWRIAESEEDAVNKWKL